MPEEKRKEKKRISKSKIGGMNNEFSNFLLFDV